MLDWINAVRLTVKQKAWLPERIWVHIFITENPPPQSGALSQMEKRPTASGLHYKQLLFSSCLLPFVHSHNRLFSRFVNKSISEFWRGLLTVWTRDKPNRRPPAPPAPPVPPALPAPPAPHTSTLHVRFESPMSIGWWSTCCVHVTTVWKLGADENFGKCRAVEHNYHWGVILVITYWETTTCFGPWWPSSGCLGST